MTRSSAWHDFPQVSIVSRAARFGGEWRSSVNGPVVDALWRQMADQGTGPHSIIKARNLLSRAFQVGHRLGVVDGNPIRDVPPPSPPPAKPIHAPTPEEVRQIIAAFNDRPTLAVWVRVMAVCGARPGEICGLQWDDLDESRSTVRIRRSIDRGGNTTPRKTGEKGHRDVQLDLPTFTALRRLPRVVGCSWVFTDDGHLPWRPERAPQEIRRAAGSLGITMRPYDLRHFAATQAIAAGRPIPEVAAMLGDNPATVMRVCAHAIPGESLAASSVAAVLDG